MLICTTLIWFKLHSAAFGLPTSTSQIAWDYAIEFFFVIDIDNRTDYDENYTDVEFAVELMDELPTVVVNGHTIEGGYQHFNGFSKVQSVG